MREIEPIKRKRTQAIKEKSYLFRINALGYPVLKNKQIALKNHHYDFIKLPSKEEDYGAWKKKKGKNYRLSEEDLACFLSNNKISSLIDLYLDILGEKERRITHEERFLLSLEESIEKMVGESLATSLFKEEKASLKEFTFTRIYSSKNKQYIRDDVNMGSEVDAWGMMRGSSTLIEIQSFSHEDFHILKENLEGESLSLDQWDLESQKVLASEAPLYFYQTQMKLLCSGFSQAVLYFVNRNTFDTLAFFVKKDKASFEWLKKVDREHRKIISLTKKVKREEREVFLKSYFIKNSLDNLKVPYEDVKSSQKQKEWISIKQEMKDLSSENKIQNKIKEFQETQEVIQTYQEKKKKLETILKNILSPEKEYKTGSFLTFLDTRNNIQIKELSQKEKI